MKIDSFKVMDFVSEFGDGIHGTPSYSENGEYYFINGNNLKDGKIVINDKTLKIDKKEYERISRNLSEKTILISINGTIGNTAFYNNEKIALGKSACFINLHNETDKYFLRYIFETKEFQKYLNQVAHGSTIKNIAPSQIANYQFKAPEKKYHKAIGNILRLIDSKIETNDKINDNLAKLAKELYDYWFVQFDFPNDEGRPYKSSGGKMVWNQELGREIPYKWTNKSLKDIFDKVTESITKNNKANLPYIPLDKMPIRKVSFGHNFGNDDAQSSLIKFQKYDVLFGAMRCYFHRVCIASTEGITRTTAFVLRSKNIKYLPFNYETINQESAVEFASRNSVGTQQPYAVWEDNFENFSFPMPEEELLLKYSNITARYIEKIISNEKENSYLRELKAFLLPILLKGKVSTKVLD